MSETGIGTFYGVGLGPGDPELLTRKAMRILSEVDWIFYPFEGRTGTSFSRRILTALAVPAAKCRQVSLGMAQVLTNTRMRLRQRSWPGSCIRANPWPG
jgi:precorrin-2 methylase